MLDHLLDLAQNQIFAALAGASVVGGVLYWLRAIPTRIYNALRYSFTFEIEISNDSAAFEAALVWVTRAVAERWYNRCFKLVSHGDIGNDDGPYNYEVEKKKKSLWLLSPATGSSHWTRFEGWPVRIHREITNAQHASHSMVREVLHLRIYSPNRDRLDRLVSGLRSVIDENATLEIFSRGLAHWKLLDRCEPRTVDSIITPGHQVREMMTDGKDFLFSESWYRERGIPYRRGWLLTGPPGVGKSSAAMCVAGQLGLPLYVLNLGSMRSDSDMIDAVNDMPNRAVLLMEDFDRRREGEEAVSLSAMLNVLDGAMAREGRLLIITANHPEEIDPVLLRPGRIDRTFEFALSGPQEAKALFARFYNDPQAAQVVNGLDQVAASAIQAAMLLHKDNPAAAYKELTHE